MCILFPGVLLQAGQQTSCFYLYMFLDHDGLYPLRTACYPKSYLFWVVFIVRVFIIATEK